MRKNIAISAVPALALLMSACGTEKELQPKAGELLPIAPAGAKTTPNANDLLATDSQARPGRSDGELTRSKERKPDEFDLPPG